MAETKRTRSGKRATKALIFTAIAAVHGLFFLQITRDLRVPSMKGDGTGDVVALQVALAPSTILDDPRSEGADEATQATAQTLPAAPEAEHDTQAVGAGAEPQIMAGGSHSDSREKEALVARAGGGGGSQDDPYARASLTPVLDAQAAFDIGAHNDAMFRARVAPCLKVSQEALAGVMVAVSLDTDGTVVAAVPARTDAPAGVVFKPTRKEAQAIAAVKACGPYHDIVLGRTPVLKMPKLEASTAAPPQIATVARAAAG